MDFTEQLFQSWEGMITSEYLQGPDIQEEIYQSWLRCKQHGVNPFEEVRHPHLCGDALEDVLSQRKQLLTVANPFMQQLYAIVKGTGFVVVLTNEEGYILKTIGDTDATEQPTTSNFFIGASWQEYDAGTNAIGTALMIKSPVQVTGPEHYCKQHHDITCSAAPIMDPRGNLIGILDISGPCASAHAHTLGMVVAAAGAIIAQLRLACKNNQLTMANTKLRNFFNMVSDAVIVLDQFGNVAEINPAVEKVLCRTGSELIGQPLCHLLDQPSEQKSVNELLRSRSRRTEQELTFSTRKGPCSCLVYSEPIVDEQDNVAGSFVTLQPVKAVQSLVHRYGGYMASLQFNDIIGDSRELKEAIELARLSAGSSSNVLLQGESGTGKEIFAQSIHNLSPRRKGPFVALNCGAIPRELVGSELFGYEEGAFTGAKKSGKPGKFELAAGGTLFLDEIGDMPLEHQAVLLRVIQEKRMTRIGGLKVIPVDVRLICATHKNLLEKVHCGTFRQDLYYRLNVMSIFIPPLRERKEDIPQLFYYFLDRLCRDRKTRITVDNAIMPYLYSYGWPGNVRELQNVVERAVNLALNGVISPSQLPEEMSGHAPQCITAPGSGNDTALQDNLNHHRQQKQQREKEELILCLDRFSGNVSQVARELKISRKTVYNRLQRHHISL